MIPEVRIIGTSGKYTIVRYTHAENESKILTSDLKEDYKKGIIDIVNPQVLSKNE